MNAAEKEDIRKAVISMIQGQIPIVCAWCTVKAVNGKTCDVILDGDEDLVVSDILLGFDNSSVVVIPKVNTDVLVIFSTKTTGAVVMVQETESVEIMGDANGGLVKIEPLVNKITALEGEINALKTIISTIIAAGGPAPSTPVTNGSLAAYFSTYNVTPITPTTAQDIENPSIKHGNG